MVYDIINCIWIVLQVILGYNLVLPLILLVLWRSTRLPAKPKQELRLSQTHDPDYAIIVTAYMQTDLIPDVINSIVRLNYSAYHVYVVADNCDISNLLFEDDRITVLRPEIILASNVKSHFHAINRFKRNHDRVTIIDSDNLVHPEYLNELNLVFERGFRAVQGIRRPVNLDTTNACLDAARDIYYHFYDGKILFELGSSATLSGSGMAFITDLYKECLMNSEISGAGFDKVLQFEIVNRGLRIAFSESAIVYDEKTSKMEQLIKQRSRWINSWFKYFHYGFILCEAGIKQFSLNKFLFGLILLRPPLFIFLVMSVVCFAVNIWNDLFVAWLWLIAMLSFVLSFVVALSRSDTHPAIYRSLINIPQFICYQIIALIKSRKPDNAALTTIHENRLENQRNKIEL